MSEIKIRIATTEDAEQLLRIYSYYVENTAITFEYEVPSLKEFQDRIKKILDRNPYLVAEQDGKITGYSYAGIFKDRAAYDWSVETTIYVDKDFHGKGIGKMLYTELERYLKLMNITNVNACIAYTTKEDQYLTNDSPAFHEKMGYKLVGKFTDSGYKFNRWYDMIWMEKMIGEHKDNQPAIIKFPDIIRNFSK